MNRTIIKSLAVFTIVAASGEVAAEDALQRRGTPQEQHAQSVFAGVFGQCRAKVTPHAAGLVAIVFSVKENGKFGATSTLDTDQNKEALRELARCMGDRANKARPFPASSERVVIGVKYQIKSDGKLLMLGAGETGTLVDGDVFQWARKRPQGTNS